MRFSTILLVTALVSVTYISLEQNKTIVSQTVTIRSGPIWQPQHRGERTDMFVTPMPPHHPYIVSEN